MKIVAIVLAAACVTAAAHATQKTSRDKVYSKAQAARGAETFAKRCESCHVPEKVPPGKEAGPVLIGEKFLAEWENRTLDGLLETTLLTMPNDGTTPLSEDETVDVIAYILQANGYPDGPSDLKYAAGPGITIVK